MHHWRQSHVIVLHDQAVDGDGKRNAHGQRLHDEENHEIGMISLPYRVSNPWTIVVEPCHATFGDVTVFGP